MAKEMSVSCDFLTNHWTCELPEHTMDMMLKVQMRMGEHTFKEDVYMHNLKYRRWNNELRPFWSLKRRVANIFRKHNSLTDNSRGTSTQTIINNAENEGEETKSVSTDSERNSVHSDWSELLSVDKEAEHVKTRSGVNVGITTTSNVSTGEAMKKLLIPSMKKTVKNIILVLYTPKPTDWGSWRIKSPYATSSIASPPLAHTKEQRKEDEMVYVPHSPYYSPVHPPEFYEDKWTFDCI